ncbi:MAG: BatD family protein [Ghiorsea sp.]
MVKWFSSLILLCVMMPQWAAAEVSANLNQYIVPFGQSVQLTIEAKGGVDGGPDIAPLKQDFDVLGQNQSSNVSIVNGSFSRSKTWSYSLMPKHEGMLQIPDIQVGDTRTKALMLRVIGGQSQTAQLRDIWLEADVSKQEVYVLAQTLLTVKLIRAINLGQAELSEPEIVGAVVERLGDDRNYEAVQDGRRVVITERRYAVFPQDDGVLTIPEVQFDGVINRSRSMFTTGQAIRLRSKPIDVHVLAKPKAWNKQDIWLPARDITVEEKWTDGATPSYKVGEPFTRSIELQGVGLTSAQLPPLLADENLVGFKTYPDQPELKQVADTQGLVGRRLDKIAMVPMQAGKLILPEIRVKWWNTETKKIQSAVIAAREIEVLPATQSASSSVSNPQPIPAATEPVQNDKPVTKLDTDKDTKLTAQRAKDYQGIFWKWFALLFAASWFITMFLWWRFSNKAMQKTEPETKVSMKFKSIEKALYAACKTNDAKQVLQLLPQWVAAFYDDENLLYLAQIKGKSEDLDAAIQGLEHAMYALHSDEVWAAGQVVWDAVQQLKQDQPSHDKKEAGLKPLY